MATLTIHDLNDALEQLLRLSAAHRCHSMEEEAHRILREALPAPNVPNADLVQRIRARFSAIGDVALPLAERESVSIATTRR